MSSAALGACYVDDDARSTSEPSARCKAAGLNGDECATLGEVVLPATLPPARGNRFADDPAAAELGFQLFFDLDAVSTKRVRCASCHAPEHGFASRFAMPTGVELVGRNAPPLVNAARMYPYFWDGRADSLWSQSLFTIENDVEMAGNRLAVAHAVAARYRSTYERAFGPMPTIDDVKRFPADGRPGTATWAAMSEADRTTITQIFVNVGKSFEAYARRASRGQSAVDRFFAGDDAALGEREKRGLKRFVQLGCRSCHAGTTFSDGRFHRLDVPLPATQAERDLASQDRGRAQGVEFLMASEFNALSPFYDRASGESARLERDTISRDVGAFRTPSLRNVSETAPYTHTGVFPTLEGVVRFHLLGGGPGAHELTARAFTDDDVADVVAFLGALRGDDAPLPWSNWPGAPVDAGYDGN